MARSRNIKPASSKNELLAQLSAHTRLLFIMLPCHADCEGKLEDRPMRLHIEIFPYEPKLDFEKMLKALHENKFITRYEVEGEKFIWINKFLKHQSPNSKEREKGSDIPDFSEISHGTKPGHDEDEHDTNKDGTGSALTLNPITLTLNPNSQIIDEIIEFYKTKINSMEIASGKRNMLKLHKNSKLSFKDLFMRVKNYHEFLQISGTVGTQYTIRMRNFFGRDARHEDYIERPTATPQKAHSGDRDNTALREMMRKRKEEREKED